MVSYPANYLVDKVKAVQYDNIQRTHIELNGASSATVPVQYNELLLCYLLCVQITLTATENLGRKSDDTSNVTRIYCTVQGEYVGVLSV